MKPAPDRVTSPTSALLFGLIITLSTVVAYSVFISGHLSTLSRLQTDLTDGNRRDSLLLLRIQNDLNQIGLAMRDMLDNDSGYPLEAWRAQFDRLRLDLDDALHRQGEIPAARRTPEQRQYLTDSLAQFWSATGRIFDLAESGHENEARTQIQLSLQARQAALTSTVARLLVQNHEAEEATSSEVQDIYRRVQRQVYWFLAATLAAIGTTSLYLIRANRLLFARLAALLDERRHLAQTLIATRESTLREIARELHDDIGQLLTAIGLMIRRATNHAPANAAVRDDLAEVGEVAQTALERVRGFSQTLHPSILEEVGLESTIDWYLSTVERQLGIKVTYERTGQAAPIDASVAIHVYRVLQEALSNVARHSGAGEAVVRLALTSDRLELEIEDRGVGPGTTAPSPPGLGLVTMRERAALVGGEVTLRQLPDGGTLVRLTVPV
jgi:signal transduction histidine kinase